MDNNNRTEPDNDILKKANSERIIERGILNDLKWHTSYFNGINNVVKQLKQSNKEKFKDWYKQATKVNSKDGDSYLKRIEATFKFVIDKAKAAGFEENIKLDEKIENWKKKEVCINYVINDIFARDSIKGKNLAEIFNILLLPDKKFSDLIPLEFISNYNSDKFFRFVDSTLYDPHNQSLILIEIKTTDKYDVIKYLKYSRIYRMCIRGLLKYDEKKNINNIFHIALIPEDTNQYKFFIRGKSWLTNNKKPNYFSIKKDYWKILNERKSISGKRIRDIIAPDEAVANTKDEIKNLTEEFGIYIITFDDFYKSLESIATNDQALLDNTRDVLQPYLD